MFFPYFLSWVIISALVYSFLNDKFGALNMVLKSIGLQPVTWYNEPGLWRGILTVINTWQSFGYNVVIYLAAIVSINNELYESAKIDGASKFDEIFRITLPQITPTIVLMLLLALGRIFYGNFGMIYAIIGDNGVLNKTTDVIDTYIYRAMRSDGDFSTGTAIGLFQSVCGFITVMIFNKLAKKYDDSMGLF
jgi:ABC-type polysaccharide transport system permease subunit